MADKSLTIKGASDPELDAIIARLQKECRVQSLIGDLKRGSSSIYIPYDNLNVSTEEPIENMYHFGVPGMHWGHRKGSASSVSSSLKNKIHSKEKLPGSDDHNKKVVLKKRPIHTMSNAELRSLNERLQLEKQYKDLTKQDKSAGEKFIKDILKNAATQTASIYVGKYMGKGVEHLLKKAAK